MKTALAFLLLTLLAAALAGDARAQARPPESDYYTVDYLVPPDGAVLEVGGLGFLADGRLAVSTRRGQVWLVDHPLSADPRDAHFTLFADGLDEGLGLAVQRETPQGGSPRDVLYVLQRGELSRLRDTDGDDRCDRIETVCNSWGLSGNYHEFGFGLPADDQGRLYLTLNVGFGDPKWWLGQSYQPWRGWVLRIDPATGVLEPVASGLRSPAGLGRNRAGDIFVTDNQGDWLPACPVLLVQPGAWYGHPASLRWTPEYASAGATPPETQPLTNARTPPVMWLPYKWSRSAGSLLEDETGGRFGPFAGQMFVSELTNGQVLRLSMEQVRGAWQGAAFQFRQRVGSAVRVEFAPDGTLFCGLTSRGWGGVPPGDGIARVRWTGRAPLEMHHVHLLQDGFEVTFTEPLAADCHPTPADVALLQYDYDWWWEYGSPERHTTKVDVASVALSPDRRTLTLHAPLVPAMVARCTLSNLRGASGAPLLHEEFDYTINQLPEGPPTAALVAKAVAPPPPRELGNEGWLFLTWVDATAMFEFTGWSHCDADVSSTDQTQFVLKPGDGALVNATLPPGQADATASATADAIPGGISVDAPPGAPVEAAVHTPGAPPAAPAAPPAPPSDYVTRNQFGDSKVHVGLMLPEGGRTQLVLQGRYALDFNADETFGAVIGPGGARVPPALVAWRGPGAWHDVDVIFEAPRFDAEGHVTHHARLVRLLVDDILLHENVELIGPSQGWERPEAPLGPLVLAGRLGLVAARDIRVRPTPPSVPVDDASAGWVPLFNGENLDGWKTGGGATWTVEDGVLVGSGPVGHLFSPRGDFRDVEVRASLKISDKGNSGLYVRATFGDSWPAGYEAQINSTHEDPVRTGSLYGLALVKTQLIPAESWFDYGVRVRDEADGTRITISVNGIVITDYVDHERRHAAGHIALQQHNDGSVIQCRRLEVRELP